MTNFPDGVMSYNEFRELSSKILDPTEVDAFCRNVFRMFDSNKDANLVSIYFILSYIKLYHFNKINIRFHRSKTDQLFGALHIKFVNFQTFDEFTIATSAKDTSPAEKLSWLFDHVYDKVGFVAFLILGCQ